MTRLLGAQTNRGASLPPSRCVCDVLPWVITTITKVQQLAVTTRWGCGPLVFQWDYVNRRQHGSYSQAHDDFSSCPSPKRPLASLLPVMISGARSCMYMRTTPSQPVLLYTLLSPGWFHCNLFVWPCCVSMRKQTRSIHHRRERGNEADRAELSIRQAGVTRPELVGRVLEKTRWCWTGSAVVKEALCLFKELEGRPQPQ